jgi:hypothetical protein
MAEHLSDAEVVMTLRNYYRRKLPALREAEARGVPIYVLKANTVPQMEQSLLSMQGAGRGKDPIAHALEEAEEAAYRRLPQRTSPPDRQPLRAAATRVNSRGRTETPRRYWSRQWCAGPAASPPSP